MASTSLLHTLAKARHSGTTDLGNSPHYCCVSSGYLWLAGSSLRLSGLVTSGSTVWYLDSGKTKLPPSPKGRPFSHQGGGIPLAIWVLTSGSMVGTVERCTAEKTWRTFASWTLKRGHGQRCGCTDSGLSCRNLCECVFAEKVWLPALWKLPVAETKMQKMLI